MNSKKGKFVLAVLSFLSALGFSALAEKTGIVQYVETQADSGVSTAVVVGDVALIHTSQFLPVDRDGRIVGIGDVAKQLEQVLENISLALRGAQSNLNRLIKLNVYTTSDELAQQCRQYFAGRFRGTVKPAVTFAVGALSHPNALVAMDAVAWTPNNASDGGVKRYRSVSLFGASNIAQTAVMPRGAKVYVSGQASEGDLVEATRKTMEKLHSTLAQLNLHPSDVVQLKAFLSPVSHAAEVEKEISSFYPSELTPPIVFVEWVPANFPIEIELIAFSRPSVDAKEAGGAVRYITPQGMTASPLYSRVAKVQRGNLIYFSGMYGEASSGAAQQIRTIFNSLGRLSKKLHTDFDHLIKTTYYVSDEDASRKLNEIRPEFYNPQRPPAASKAIVRGTGKAGTSITLDMIAVAQD